MTPSLNHRILALAVPSIIANITTPLLGLVDTAVTGHMGNESYLAAIAVGSSMFNLLYWLFAFLRMGTSGMTAIAHGKASPTLTAITLYRGLLVSTLVAVAMIALSPLIVDALLWFLSPDPETASLAAGYFKTVIWSAPAVLGTYVLTGWFLGMQSSKRPMVISILINIVNIGLSPFLAFVLEMKLDGVATGTLTAQWAGLIAGLLLCRHYHPGRVPLKAILEPHSLQHYFAVNIDIMLRTACLIAVTLWFTREGARQGDLMLAVNSLLMQLFILFSYTADAFAFAGEALVGHFNGSCDTRSLHRCVRKLLVWGATLAAAYSIIYFIAGDKLLSVLTDNDNVRAAARAYEPWAVTVPLAGFLAFIWDGVYIGYAATRKMLLTMAIAMSVFFLLYYSFRNTLGINHALWLAFITYLLTRGLAQTILWRKIKT
ncbi:MAG: MATE family efflux transporter [Clostridiales bacterium]|nr:MATE family efflux transporter [Clostridiales bacterium]